MEVQPNFLHLQIRWKGTIREAEYISTYALAEHCFVNHHNALIHSSPEKSKLVSAGDHFGLRTKQRVLITLRRIIAFHSKLLFLSP